MTLEDDEPRTATVLPDHWRHAYRCAYKWSRMYGVRYQIRWSGRHWDVRPK